MSAKTYRARTMKEVLAKVRRDLGGDAVILASREVRRRRILGLGSRELIEVKASRTRPDDAAAPAGAAGLGSTLSASSQERLGEQLSQLHAMVERLTLQGRVDHLLPELPGPLIP